jgi:hypothetical protein
MEPSSRHLAVIFAANFRLADHPGTGSVRSDKSVPDRDLALLVTYLSSEFLTSPTSGPIQSLVPRSAPFASKTSDVARVYRHGNKILRARSANPLIEPRLHIPDEVDQRSGVMSITIPG